MPSIKTKQVAGVTALVGAVVVALGLVQIVSIARLSLADAQARAELLANAMYQAASKVVPGSPDPARALREDPGVRSLLESSVAYARGVAFAAIVDTRDVAIAHSFPGMEGQTIPPHASLEALRQESAWAQIRAIYSDQLFEVRQPLLVGGREFGSIRIALSMLLVREGLGAAVRRAVRTALVALVVAVLVAVLLAQWMLRPIHVIKSGLTRLGQGEFNVRLDLPPGEEFRLLGSSFEAVSAQLARTRAGAGSPPAAPEASLASVGEALEDAVALFGPDGDLRFANAAMRAILPEARTGRPIADWLDERHVCRRLVEGALGDGRARGPVDAALGPEDRETGGADRAVLVHAVKDADGRVTGALLVARNVAYLDRVQSMVNYSRKLSSFSRLMAGVAHEVKNPLNAMTIHLELLKQKLQQAAQREREAAPQPLVAEAGEGGSLGGIREAPPPAAPDLARHVATIGDGIKRLDQVMGGLLKFLRPEELRLQPVQLADVMAEVARVVEPEARRASVAVRIDCPARSARHQRRSGHAAAGAREPRPERLPGDAGRRHPRPARPRRGPPPRRGHRDRHRRRHRAGSPRAHLRSLLHDQGARQRHRPLARLPDRAAARRRDRRRVHTRPRDDVPADVSKNVILVRSRGILVRSERSSSVHGRSSSVHGGSSSVPGDPRPFGTIRPFGKCHAERTSVGPLNGQA